MSQSDIRRQSSADRNSKDRVRNVQKARNGSGSSSRRRTSSSSYGSASRGRRNGRRKRPQDNSNLLLLIIGGGLVVILALLLAFNFFNKEKDAGAVVGEKETTTIAETEMDKEITVDGVSIGGMNYETAKSAILESFGWGMKAVYNGESHEVSNLLEAPVDTILREIYGGSATKESYSINLKNLEDAIAAEAASIASKWDVAAQNGGISGYDKSNSKFTYESEVDGFAIDQKKLASDIKSAVNKKNYKAKITATGSVVKPEITAAQAKELYTTIGTFTTKTTSNKDRNTNIRLASEAINGAVIKPGEVFSINSMTGERTYEKGYKPAGAYVNGELVEEPGGGVCQVSSTLYNAIILSGLKTTERYPHSYEPSYVTPGEDAMISYPGLDMKFVNNSKDSVVVRATFADQTLTISIVGIPILEPGEVISMESEKTKDIEPPETIYEEDTTLQPGTEVVTQKAAKGSTWVTYLVTSKNGEVISREFFHNSNYKPKPAKIRRNSTGVVTGSNESAEPSSEGSSIQDGTLDTVIPGINETQPVNTDDITSDAPQDGDHTGPGSDPTSPMTEKPGSMDKPDSDASTAPETTAPTIPEETTKAVISPGQESTQVVSPGQPGGLPVQPGGAPGQ